MFPVDDPTSPPLIGPSTIVVVNDARHQLQPEFLQRTTPYFFDVDSITQQYKWAKVHTCIRLCCVACLLCTRARRVSLPPPRGCANRGKCHPTAAVPCFVFWADACLKCVCVLF